MSIVADDALESIDAALQEWRQGDVVRAPDLFFIHIADLGQPLTEAAKEAALDIEVSDEDGLALAEIPTSAPGLVVITQTCDIVRRCNERPFIELAPLVSGFLEEELRQIRSGRRPRYAVVPALALEGLVADLDRTMTVEKAVLARWPRTVGCRTDEERRAFADALARKRNRPAFLNDFTEGVSKFLRRIQDRHAKGSPEGQMLDALREIRVTAAPSWDAERVTLVFWFIRKGTDPFDEETWITQIEKWLSLLTLPERFVLDDPAYRLRRLEDMTAREYVESDRLDLDYLSHH